MEIRFLNRDEYGRTRALAAACFGSSDDLAGYYENVVRENRVAVLEDGGAILSMAHLHRMLAVYAEKSVPVWYILYVCTEKAHRHRGYMDRVMRFVLQTLQNEGEAFTFLVPVNREVYAHLGFTDAWRFDETERELLDADDDLTECVACRLNNDESFTAPLRLKNADTPSDLRYRRFDADAAADSFAFFRIRPNKSYDSVPLDCLIWSDRVKMEYCVSDGRCLLMRSRSDDAYAGCIPYCREQELSYYFKLQERYFNEVLGIPFRAFSQDSEGVKYLRSAGLLETYEVTEEAEIFDYIYSGDDLRTLAGRSFSQKRNRIHKFEREYGGRWEYRTLGYEDRETILAFLERWDENKTVEGAGINLGKDYDAAETLEIDVSGTRTILESPNVLKKIRVGGIFVDGALCAFSIGSYNPAERMAVIDIEKADPHMDGLYQLINREFLLHEFPEAELVNREDDVGVPGLRQAKMSYNPILLEKRYSLIQKDFPGKRADE